MTNTHQKYPNRLRQTIKQSGFTVEQIAEETEIPLRTLFDYCAGRVPIPRNRLEVLASALGYPTEYLVPTYSDIVTIGQPSRDSFVLVDSDVSVASEQARNSIDQLRRHLLQQTLGVTSVALAAPVSVSEERHYLDLAMQILEMAISEYRWSGDTVEPKVIQDLRNVLQKSNSGEISRRQLVLFGTGTILTLSNPLALVPEEILPFCTQNIATCWQMSNGGRDDLTHARWMISSYLPTLATLATQSSPHQKSAASQAAECYRLRSVLDYHIENLAVAEEDAKQCIYYSKLTEDPEWIVRAHAHFALVSHYRGQPEQALVACRDANRYKNQASPAALFALYRAQATYEAQISLKDEATASLHIAYNNLLQATHGPSRAYVDTNLYEWVLWKGITHYHLGEYNESKAILESVDPLNPGSLLPERIRTGILNNLVFAELRAKERDMERCIMIWKSAAAWAKKLQSELRLAEVRTAYNRFLLVFPHEPRVTALKELIV